MRRAVAQVSYGCSLRHRSMGDGGEPLVLPRLRFIGDVLLPRELRYPADHWGRTAVVCGRSTFWMENAVPDLLGVRPHAGTAFRLARPCAPGWLSQMMTDSVVTDRVPYQGSVRLRGTGRYSTRSGSSWPRGVRTARASEPRGVHPSPDQWYPTLVQYQQLPPEAVVSPYASASPTDTTS